MQLAKLGQILIVSSLSLSSALIHAARPAIETSVDPSRSRNGEQVLFKIVVRNEGNERVRSPAFPQLPEWEVINRYQNYGSTTRFMNGQTIYQTQNAFTFILKPRRKGNLKIPALDIRVGAKVYKSAEQIVRVDRVNPGSTRPPSLGRRPLPNNPFGGNAQRPRIPGFNVQPNPQDINPKESFFIRGEPSKTTAYVGELIELDYAVYQKSMGNFVDPTIAKFPAFKGFIKEDLYIPSRYVQRPVAINGQTYFRSELFRYAIFPLKAGEVTIEPMVFKATVMPSQADILGSLLGGGPPPDMNNMGIPMRKSSEEIRILAKPLPPPEANTPQFTGAVGNFEMEFSGPKNNAVTGQPFSVKLTLAGRGNIKSIEEPVLNIPKSVEPFNTKSEYEFREDGSGFKIFEYLLIARRPGPLVIPPFEYSYFDPESGQYKTLRSQELKIVVEGASSPNLAGNNAEENNSEKQAPSFSTWSIGSQKFLSLAEVNQATFLASKAMAGVHLLAFSLLGVLFIRKKRREQIEAQFSAAPWNRTLKQIRSHNLWPAEKLAELVDLWTRQRLAAELSKQSEDIKLYDESTRDDFYAAILYNLDPDKHSIIEPLRQFWNQLDLYRFSNSKSENLKTKTLVNRADTIVTQILKSKMKSIAKA